MTCLQSENKVTLRSRIHRAAQRMDVPEGMLCGLPQLTLDGDLQLLIERHLGITEYGTQRILIASRRFTIEISGESMYLVAMDRDNIRIRGTIHGVRFLGGDSSC